MFLGQVIKTQRRQKGLSQTELADQITNQNVISNLERKSKAPKNSILVKLLQRLDLTLNDVYSEFTNIMHSELKQELTSIEQRLLNGTYDGIEDELGLVGVNLDSAELTGQHDFIIALFNVHLKNTADADFELDKVLRVTKNDIYNVYTLLAYITKANVYLDLNQFDKAQYFFDVVEAALKENFNVANATTLQKIYICQQLSNYHLQADDFKSADKYADIGIKLNQDEHRCLFLDHFYFIKAKANKDTRNFDKYMQLALAFATYENNYGLKSEINSLMD